MEKSFIRSGINYTGVLNTAIIYQLLRVLLVISSCYRKYQLRNRVRVFTRQARIRQLLAFPVLSRINKLYFFLYAAGTSLNDCVCNFPFFFKVTLNYIIFKLYYKYCLF